MSKLEIKNKSNIIKESLETSLFEWTTQSHTDIKVINKAENIYFWDGNDNKIMDFNSQAMCVNLGHQETRILNAIINQFHLNSFTWGKKFTTKIRRDLAKALISLLPDNISKLSFLSTGSEANEHAIRIARDFTKKKKILARHRSYHGATLGSMSLSSDTRRSTLTHDMPGVVHVPSTYVKDCRWCKKEGRCNTECLNFTNDIIRYEDKNTIAAFIIEPVTGANGIIIPTKEYMKGLHYLCKKNDILLIADEVMSGFGRTGKYFAIDHWNIKPDLITMAKGLTSGYFPLSALAVSGEISDYFKNNTYNLGSTYNAHPLGCAVALECINIYREDKIIENSYNLGKVLTEELSVFENHSYLQVRNIGLFGVLDFDKNYFEPIKQTLAKLQEELYQKGVFVAINDNFLFLIPPLIITEKQLKKGTNIIKETILKLKP